MAKPAAKVGLFPGTFDPITNGHLDVIRRGVALFDTLVVAIGQNPAKRELFSMEERFATISELMDDIPGVKVSTYQGLTVDYAMQIGATAILRGIRNVTDLNFEFQLALTNRAIANIETVFMMTGDEYAFTSSSLIKQIAAAPGGDIDRLRPLLPALVLQKLKEKKEDASDPLSWIRVDGLKD